ncbi:MAG: ABC transporter permease subunit [Dysgonamonadaceae bacterium]|jgi:NitT/TauT family transport system permease protein|nr:ABC transporter permease subunit [Dysgonamonadaceae bacterium]
MNPKRSANKKYWKPKSKRWLAAAILSPAAAVAASALVPNVQAVNTLYYRTALVAFLAALLVLWTMRRFRNRLYHYSQFIAAAGLALTVLDLLTTKSNILKLPFFPGPTQIVEVLYTERAMLFVCTVYSLRLFFAGLACGVILGVATGVMTGWNRQWNYWLFPVLKIIGVIPPVAWIPLALVVFPTSFYAGIFLLALASWFSIAFMVAGGIASTPKAYFEVSRTLGASERFLLFHVAIPNAVPSIFTGIATSAGMCFMTLVITEMIGAKAGLGWYINWAKAWASYDKVYASILIMGAAFCIILGVINLFRNYFLRWQK